MLNNSQKLSKGQLVMGERGDREKYYVKINKSKKYKEGFEMILIFALAAVVGFLEKNKKTIKSSDYITRKSYIKDNTNIKNLLQAIAIVDTNSLEVILDENKVFSIAEQYANGGIKKLYQIVLNESDEPDIEMYIEIGFNKFFDKYIQ